MHLGHSKIIEYAERPFKDCNHMNKRLIHESNMRVNFSDTVVHVGDFCIRNPQGVKFAEWRARLTGDWVFTKGNHDRNNGVKPVCNSMFCSIGRYTAFVSHVPFFYEDWFDEHLRHYVVATCDFAICGHVHKAWAYDNGHGIPVINVGVDVRDYRPVSDDEVINLYEKLRK